MYMWYNDVRNNLCQTDTSVLHIQCYISATPLTFAAREICRKVGSILFKIKVNTLTPST